MLGCLRVAVLLWIAGSVCLLPAQPRRIVSTAPSITEILFALGVGDRVVAVTDYCRYPREARSRPRIGSYTQPSLEAIAAQRPDLVVIQTNPVDLKRKLEALKLRVLEVDQGTLENLDASIAQIGAAAGAGSRAQALRDSLARELNGIRAQASRFPPTRVLFVVGRSPNSLEGLVAVGQSSYLNQVLELAGGRNIFRDAVAPYPSVSLEEVIARNPEVILDMGDMTATEGVTESHKRAVVRLWDRARTISAVKNGRVHAIAADRYVVPGPRVVDAARDFLRLLHPEVQ